jgi:hypothetical protein
MRYNFLLDRVMQDVLEGAEEDCRSTAAADECWRVSRSFSSAVIEINWYGESGATYITLLYHSLRRKIPERALDSAVAR